MIRTMLKSKLHKARVNGLCLDYEGSITIDAKIMAQADLFPYEQVEILNLNNGARFNTYVIEGEAGEKDICLNGPAARLAKLGDIIIILSYCQLTDDEMDNFQPKLVYLNKDNDIEQIRHFIDTMPS
jgi:aspartate 1-decarboxylase